MKQGFRFSLLGLFAVMTIAALAVSLYLTQSRLASTEAEAGRLRKETGNLTIDDPTQVHVIAVPMAQAMTWRWRVYLPAGHDFGIYSYLGKFDSRGLPEAGTSSRARIGGQSNPNEPREILIDVALDKTLEGDPCLRIRENGQGFSAVHFGESLPSWVSGQSMYLEKTAGDRTVVSAVVEVPLGLIRLDGVAGPQGETSDDAVLIWIGKYEKTAVDSLRDRGILPKSH